MAGARRRRVRLPVRATEMAGPHAMQRMTSLNSPAVDATQRSGCGGELLTEGLRIYARDGVCYRGHFDEGSSSSSHFFFQNTMYT